MRIAIDARIIKSSTGRYVENLLRQLEELDHENDYLILVRRADRDYYQPRNKRFQVLVAEFADYSFGEQLGFARLLSELRVDLVHFCMPQQPLLYGGPSVTTVHDLNLLRITANDDMGPLELRVKKRIFAVLLWLSVHKTRHIFTPSQFTKDDVLQFSHIPARKVTVTPEGADITSHRAKALPAFKDTQFIMYVGRAEPYKNNRRLIEAHQELLEHYPELHLLIIGKKDVLRKADMHWVEEKGFVNVDFLGFVSDEELSWLYAHTAAYVFPSSMEGFGLPGLEAMSYGAPVVSSNATSLPEVYGPAAHYFNPHSLHDMVRAIHEIIEDKTLQKRLLAASQEQVKKYSWRHMAKQTLQVYKDILRQSRK